MQGSCSLGHGSHPPPRCMPKPGSLRQRYALSADWIFVIAGIVDDPEAIGCELCLQLPYLRVCSPWPHSLLATELLVSGVVQNDDTVSHIPHAAVRKIMLAMTD